MFDVIFVLIFCFLGFLCFCNSHPFFPCLQQLRMPLQLSSLVHPSYFLFQYNLHLFVSLIWLLFFNLWSFLLCLLVSACCSLTFSSLLICLLALPLVLLLWVSSLLSLRLSLLFFDFGLLLHFLMTSAKCSFTFGSLLIWATSFLFLTLCLLFFHFWITCPLSYWLCLLFLTF